MVVTIMITIVTIINYLGSVLTESLIKLWKVISVQTIN